MKSRILVTAAVGHTGTIVVQQLLSKGFRVRAFVRHHDARSEALRQLGADFFAGDLADVRDLRAALVDEQRTYYCVPFAPNLLHRSILFAIAAEEARVGHPSIQRKRVIWPGPFGHS